MPQQAENALPSVPGKDGFFAGLRYTLWPGALSERIGRISFLILILCVGFFWGSVLHLRELRLFLLSFIPETVVSLAGAIFYLQRMDKAARQGSPDGLYRRGAFLGAGCGLASGLAAHLLPCFYIHDGPASGMLFMGALFGLVIGAVVGALASPLSWPRIE